MNKNICPFQPEQDLQPLIELRRQLGADISLEEQQAELAWPNQDPTQDHWVVAAQDQTGQLVGQAFGFHTIPERYLAWIEVLPANRRQGIGSELLRNVITRARQLGTKHILINADERKESAPGFLTHHGFRAVSHIWMMSAPVGMAIAEPLWPYGYTVHSFADIRDYRILHDAYYGCCADLIGNGANSRRHRQENQATADHWAHWIVEENDYGEGIFIAFAPNGEIAGICRGFLGTTEDAATKPTGYVDALGVAPSHRQAALWRALALTVMGWLRAQGQGALTLEAFGVDESVMHLYRSLGFALDTHLIAWQRDLLLENT
ncbi:MAG: GNAT family N-acetyltransferase [Caldilineaceae bacterium]|nr:GNAT family N-acetyltransferase [Caldilineaceae bacterium]